MSKFTPAQVAALERYQASEHVHPLTCCDHQVMRPMEAGLVCPKCGRVQDWAPPECFALAELLDNNELLSQQLEATQAAAARARATQAWQDYRAGRARSAQEWLQELQSDELLVLRFRVPPDANVEQAAEALAELVRALNAFHIACGGQGLQLVTNDEAQPAAAGCEDNNDKEQPNDQE